MQEKNLVTLTDADGATAVIAPELGGWLLRYSRPTPKHGPVEALHFSQAIVDRYPREMYAGMPVLFPLVSNNRVGDKEHHYEWNGAIHEMPQHGFARRSRWAIRDQTPDSLTLELTDNEVTRANYPFAFRFRLVFRLHQGRLHWEQVVENRSDEPLPFGAGFHPYFAAPLTPQSRRESCFVEIPDAKRLVAVGRFERFTTEPFLGQNWSVDKDVAGTMYLTDLKRQELILIDPASELEVVFNFEEAPQHRFVALWAKSTREPYYCLEPWTSLPNAFSRLKDRELIVLDPNKTFRAAMWLELRPMA